MVLAQGGRSVVMRWAAADAAATKRKLAKAPSREAERSGLLAARKLGLEPEQPADAESDDAASPVFSYDDDPAGAPLKLAVTVVPEPKVALPPVRDASAAADSVVEEDEEDQSAGEWTAAQTRFAEYQEHWRRQLAAECIQRCVRSFRARRWGALMRAERRAQLRHAAEEWERRAAEKREREVREAELAREAEAARLEEEQRLAQLARAEEQRQAEALQTRVESQRERRRQQLEFKRAAAAAARESLHPGATAKEVSQLAAQLLPEIEAEGLVLVNGRSRRAETAPSGERREQEALPSDAWPEFAALFAGAGEPEAQAAVRPTEEPAATQPAVRGQPARYRVPPPRPYDDWLQSDEAGGGAPWRQRGRTSSAPTSLDLGGKLVLPPVRTRAPHLTQTGHSERQVACRCLSRRSAWSASFQSQAQHPARLQRARAAAARAHPAGDTSTGPQPRCGCSRRSDGSRRGCGSFSRSCYVPTAPRR